MPEGIVAKKKFGQNFLKDRSVVRKIVESMPKKEMQVVEIGPGLGDLTEELLRYYRVIAYEVDVDLYQFLLKKFKSDIESERLILKLGDVLEYWERDGLFGDAYQIVANLPYNVGTNIVLRALKDPFCMNIIAMLQKEVALKFCANSGESEYSAIGVISQTVADGRILLEVPPTAFEPMPKVDSIVFELAKFENFDDRDFEKFLRVAFSAPRKIAFKNLSASFEKKELEIAYQEENLDRNLRPHQISAKYYHLLFKRLKKGDINGKQRE